MKSEEQNVVSSLLNLPHKWLEERIWEAAKKGDLDQMQGFGEGRTSQRTGTLNAAHLDILNQPANAFT